MEGKAQTEETRCPTIAYLLDNFPPGTLRREQRKMVAQHLDSCPTCTERYPNPPHLPRNDGIVQLNTGLVTRRVTAKVLVIVAVRHAAILGGRGGPYAWRRPVNTSHIRRVAARTSSGRAWAIASSRALGSTTVASSPSKSSRSSVSSAMLPPMAT